MSETRELVRLAKDHGTNLNWQQVEALAAVCEVLLAAHPVRECEFYDGCGACQRCPDAHPLDQDSTAARWCQPCRDRALLAECDRAARGEA